MSCFRSIAVYLNLVRRTTDIGQIKNNQVQVEVFLRHSLATGLRDLHIWSSQECGFASLALKISGAADSA